VASISPRFGPARSVIFSTSAWITSAASLRLSGLLSASVSRSTFFLTDTGHVRMDVRNIQSFLRQKSLNHVLARLEFAHTFGHAASVSTFFNHSQHLLQGALEIR
jgi:hypothetical protein